MSCGETLLVQVGHSMSDQPVFCNDLLRFALNLACLLTFNICDPSARNQSHVGRVRLPLRAEMHGRGHIADSCFIAFITYKIC